MDEHEAKYKGNPHFSLKALLYSCAVLPPGVFLCVQYFDKVMYALSHPGLLTLGWLSGCMMIGSGVFSLFGKPVRGALLALAIQIPLYLVGLAILAIFGRFT